MFFNSGLLALRHDSDLPRAGLPLLAGRFTADTGLPASSASGISHQTLQKPTEAGVSLWVLRQPLVEESIQAENATRMAMRKHQMRGHEERPLPIPFVRDGEPPDGNVELPQGPTNLTEHREHAQE